MTKEPLGLLADAVFAIGEGQVLKETFLKVLAFFWFL